jgi:hypothetical protein
MGWSWAELEELPARYFPELVAFLNERNHEAA